MGRNARLGGDPPPARILLVGDEPAWAEALAGALAAAGHVVSAVRGGAAARAAVAAEAPDLVVVDLILPDDDGLVLCADLKAAADLSVLICGATRRRHEAVLGLRLGADDFVRKPCDLDELAEHLGAVLRARRRSAVPAPAGDPPRLGQAAEADALVLDHGRRQARLGAAAAALTPAEYRLLGALAECAGEAVPRRALVGAVFGRPKEGRALDMVVRRLRGKLAALGPRAPWILTVRGFGIALKDGKRMSRQADA